MPRCPSCAAPTTGASRRCPECGHVAGSEATVRRPVPEAARETFRREPPPSAPAPPAPTAPTTPATRLVALAAVTTALAGVAVLAVHETERAAPPGAGPPSASVSPQPSHVGFAGQPTGALLLADSDEGPLVIDVDAGLVRPISLDPALQADADAVPVASLDGGETVVYALTDGRVVVAPAARFAPGIPLGTAQAVVAATDRSSVWVMRETARRTTVAERYASDGSRLARVRLPAERRLAAVVDRGLVAVGHDPRRPVVAVVDHTSGAVVTELGDAQLIAAHGDVVVWRPYPCDPFHPAGCGLRATSVSERRTRPLGLGYAEALALDAGRFSPDGTKLAVFEARRDETGGGVVVEPAVIDVRSGRGVPVPDVEFHVFDGSLQWSPDGRWLFYAPGTPSLGRLGAYELMTGRHVRFPALRRGSIRFVP